MRKTPLIAGSRHSRMRKALRPAPALYAVFVRDLVLAARVGIHAHEHDIPQRIRLNVELQAELPAAGGRGTIHEVVCYEDFIVRVKAMIGRAHVGLMETLAQSVIEIGFIDRRVHAVKVRIEKLDVFDDADSVGIEIERWRSHVFR